MKGKEIHCIEEYFEGIDGHSPDDWCRGFVAYTLEQARDEEDVEEITWEFRTILAGTTKSEKAWHWHCPTSHEPHAVVMALKQKAERQPGDSFAGQLRLNARVRGATTSDGHLGSFSRKMRPASTEIATHNGGTGNAARGAPLMHEAVKPWHDMHMQLLDRCSRLMVASANVLESSHPPAAAGGSDTGAILSAMTNIGAAAMRENGSGGRQQAPAQLPGPAPHQHQGAGAQVPWERTQSAAVLVPPSDAPAGEQPRALPGPPPSPGIDEDSIMAWCRANPERARELGMKLYTEIGP